MWRNSTCYSNVHGIDGSECSILRYLTEVEPHCPPNSEFLLEQALYTDRGKASMMYDYGGLVVRLPKKDFEWPKQRIICLWADWVAAGESFVRRHSSRRKKNVLLYTGAFADVPAFLTEAGRGGPLGELVQWSDLIASLYILGHNITVISTKEDLPKYVDTYDQNMCFQTVKNRNFDVVYSDIVGVLTQRIHLMDGPGASIKCKLRLLDSFGTEAEYNYPGYAKNHDLGDSGWAGLNLQLSQFLTLFPHSPDNRFLGFVVGNGNHQNNFTKTNIALVYGKLSSYFKDSVDLPEYVINHGPVSGAEVQRLLGQAKLFVGLGFPYEGPGPLEEMAAGTVFLQPKYPFARNRENEKFFAGKPTRRKLTSQSPYMEEMVREPYAFTIDISDEKLLNETLKRIRDMEPLPPRIPKEFTNEGMLERVHVFTEHMNLCDVHAKPWPPVENMHVYLSNAGQSCKDACWSKGMVCEQTYFTFVNRKEGFEKLAMDCSTMQTLSTGVDLPSYDRSTRTCLAQANSQLFSCVAVHIGRERVCPCREAEKENFQLCPNCLR